MIEIFRQLGLQIMSNQCKAPVIVKIQFYEQYLETQILSDQDLTVESWSWSSKMTHLQFFGLMSSVKIIFDQESF
jgi:hypothetical protein